MSHVLQEEEQKVEQQGNNSRVPWPRATFGAALEALEARYSRRVRMRYQANKEALERRRLLEEAQEAFANAKQVSGAGAR
jgi:hypothetical protein